MARLRPGTAAAPLVFFPRRNPHLEISAHQCPHRRIAVRKSFAKPAVDSLEASCSRRVSHAFAEDPAIIRLSQIQARCESVEPFPRVSAEGLHGLRSFSLSGDSSLSGCAAMSTPHLTV